MKKLLKLAAVGGVSVLVLLMAGPASSGALLLLLPIREQPIRQESGDHTPLHKGRVDLDIGVYFRENDDIVVPGTPLLVLRRSYAAGYRVSREFGIGTTHADEWLVLGDGKQFQWVELHRPAEPRVRFERTSSGTSLFNAMYEHRARDNEWTGARLGWTGIDWALRRSDGMLARFRPCGSGGKHDRCTITSYRDPDGHVTRYQRTPSGRLERIESGPDRWIAFNYDDEDRVVRALASTKREVRYEYDDRGRLARVKSGDVVTHRYSYTDLDEMSTIDEPDVALENSYENGRCIRQVIRYADGSPPYIFDFEYKLEGSRIVETVSRRSDGTWAQYAFDKNGFTTAETLGAEGHQPVSFVIERDPSTSAARSLTLTCPDRTGQPLRHSSLITRGGEDWLKWDLVRTHCSWSPRQRRTPR